MYVDQWLLNMGVWRGALRAPPRVTKGAPKKDWERKKRGKEREKKEEGKEGGDKNEKR